MNRKTICFISETARGDRPLQDPSVRYRCYHPAEALQRIGHLCTISSAHQFYQNPCFDYDVYIFHRPNVVRSGFINVINTLLNLGRKLIADYDDLIFGDESVALISSAVKNKTLTPERAISAFSGNLAGLRAFNNISVSTAPLAEWVQKYNPQATVKVVPNIIPDSILDFHTTLQTTFRQRSPYMIGYFSGTKSHDHDFPIVEAALHRALSEDRRLSLLVVGPVTIPQGIASLPCVTVAPVVNYLRLPGLMTMCSTVIAPLEDSAFNACKSRVKFLEAALSGCRLIASPIPDMQEIGPSHLTSATNTDDWYEALVEPFDGTVQREFVASNFDFLHSHRCIDGLVALGELQ